MGKTGRKNPNAGRPRGSRNDRSLMLLKDMEKYSSFRVAKELLEIYGFNKSVLKPMFERMVDNLSKDLPAQHGFSKEDIDMFNTLNKQTINLLTKMLAYLYPKLATLQMDTGSHQKVVFNINTLNNLPQSTVPQDVINITPSEPVKAIANEQSE